MADGKRGFRRQVLCALLISGIGLLSSIGQRWAGADGEPSKLLERRFDLRPLLQDYTSEEQMVDSPWLGIEFHGGAGHLFDDRDEQGEIEVGDLLGLLSDGIAAENEQDGSARFRTEGQTLIVRAEAAIQRQVQRRLAQFKLALLSSVHLELREYRGSGAALTSLMAKGPRLGADRRKSLDGDAWTLVNRQVLEAPRGRAITRSRITEHPLLSRVELDRAGKQAVEIDHDEYHLGQLLELRAVPSSDGAWMVVRCRREIARADGPATLFDTKVGAGVGKVQQARVRHHSLDSTLVLPRGGAGVVGAWQEGEHRRVIVVLHRERAPTRFASPQRVTKAPASAELRLFDARMIGTEGEMQKPFSFRGGFLYIGPKRLIASQVASLLRRECSPTSWKDEAAGAIHAADGLIVLRHRSPELLKRAQRWLVAREAAARGSVATRVRLLSVAAKSPASVLLRTSRQFPASKYEAMLRVPTSGLRCTLDSVQGGLLHEQSGSADVEGVPYVDEVYPANEDQGTTIDCSALRVGRAIQVRASRDGGQAGGVMLTLSFQHRQLGALKSKRIGRFAQQTPKQWRADVRFVVWVKPGQARVLRTGRGLLLVESWLLD